MNLSWRGDPADIIAALDGDDAAARVRAIIDAARPDWYAEAECRKPEHADVSFFPGKGQSAAPARAVCSACTVIEQCAAAADASAPGIWGGTSPQERRALRNRTTPQEQ